MRQGLLFLAFVAGCSLPPTLEGLDERVEAVLEAPGVFVEEFTDAPDGLTRRVGLSRAANFRALASRVDEQALEYGAVRSEETDPSALVLVYRLGEESLRLKFFRRPAIAVVIDDWGMTTAPLKVLAQLPAPVNVAVIPFQRHSSDCAREAVRLGHEVLVHMPMQSKEGEAQEERTLRLDMKGETIRETLKQAFQSVPGAAGMNNHQGSLATANRPLMRLVMDRLKNNGSYFLDSRTAPESVAKVEAASAGVRFATRNYFLDNDREAPAIRAQWDKVVKRARRRGSCIAIGHPYPETLAVLLDELPRLEGIDLIKVSGLTEELL